MSDETVHGLANGLTNYGDKDFALYLRRSFARSMGYSNDSVKERRIDLLVAADELERRKREKGSVSPPVPARGYGKLYAEEILGADEGCDFRFLKSVA
jgi:hypothetical protein